MNSCGREDRAHGRRRRANAREPANLGRGYCQLIAKEKTKTATKKTKQAQAMERVTTMAPQRHARAPVPEAERTANVG